MILAIAFRLALERLSFFFVKLRHHYKFTGHISTQEYTQLNRVCQEDGRKKYKKIDPAPLWCQWRHNLYS